MFLVAAWLFPGDNLDVAGMQWLRRSRDPRRYVRPQERTALLSPPPCLAPSPAPATPLRLLMLVTSAPAHRERRQVIRETWGGRSENARLVFVLGRAPAPATQPSAEVSAEAQRHGDLVVEDFTDAYQNLTLKTLFLLKWAVRECPAAAFVLKTDDDMLINTRGLVRALPRWVAQVQAKKARVLGRGNGAAPPLVFGHVFYRTFPYRYPGSKWFLPLWLHRDVRLPDFVSGTAYVMTRSALVALYAEALDTPLLPLEDVFLTGVVRSRRLGIPLIHVPRFWPYDAKLLLSENQSCFHYMFSLHGFSPKEMQQQWSSLARLEPRTPGCASFLKHLLEKLGTAPGQMEGEARTAAEAGVGPDAQVVTHGTW